jgi:hypothetical protein
MATETSSGGVLRRHRTAALALVFVALAVAGTAIYAAAAPATYSATARVSSATGSPIPPAALAAYSARLHSPAVAGFAARRLTQDSANAEALAAAAADIRRHVDARVEGSEIAVTARYDGQDRAAQVARAYAASLVQANAGSSRQVMLVQGAATTSGPLARIAIAATILLLIAALVLIVAGVWRPRAARTA